MDWLVIVKRAKFPNPALPDFQYLHGDYESALRRAKAKAKIYEAVIETNWETNTIIVDASRFFAKNKS